MWKLCTRKVSYKMKSQYESTEEKVKQIYAFIWLTLLNLSIWIAEIRYITNTLCLLKFLERVCVLLTRSCRPCGLIRKYHRKEEWNLSFCVAVYFYVCNALFMYFSMDSRLKVKLNIFACLLMDLNTKVDASKIESISYVCSCYICRKDR